MAATAPKDEDTAIPKKLLDEAQGLKIAVEHRSEEQVRQAVRKAWVEENLEAMEAWNAWVKKNGLPFERYRAF